MERDTKTTKQVKKVRNTKRLNSVDRLFLSSDDKTAAKNPYEDEYYSQTEDLSSYFNNRKKPHRKKPAKLRNPAFFSIYGEDDIYEEPEDKVEDEPLKEQKPSHSKQNKRKKTKNGSKAVVISLFITILLIVAVIVVFILSK